MDKKETLDEEILKIESQLKLKNSPENILKLRKQKLQILFKLKQYESVINTGFLFVGSEGPDVFVFKYIVAAYCHDKKYQEALDTLEKWTKNYKDEAWKLKEFRDGVLKSRASSITPGANAENIEELFGIHECDLDDRSVETGVWRYRSPPAQTVTYFICPRISDYVPCLFGDSCLAAHSKEELEEWKARAKGISPRPDSYSYSKAVVLGMSPPPHRHYANQGHVQGETREPRLTGALVNNYGPWLPSPPANTPYLNQLIKSYADHTQITDFWSNVEGVKLTWSGPLQIRTNLHDYTWIVFIRSQRRDTLRTISLLNDLDRINFRISEAYFCDDGTFTQPINLMEANTCNHKNKAKLQVLSTFIPPNCLNRSCYYYRIGFTFRTLVPGNFAQTIVFDFKEKPKLVQALTVQVEATPKQVESAPAQVSAPTSSMPITATTTLSGSNPYSIISQINALKLAYGGVLRYSSPPDLADRGILAYSVSKPPTIVPTTAPQESPKVSVAVPSPRAPSVAVPSPRAPSVAVPSPRAQSVAVPSPMSKSAAIIRPPGIVQDSLKPISQDKMPVRNGVKYARLGPKERERERLEQIGQRVLPAPIARPNLSQIISALPPQFAEDQSDHGFLPDHHFIGRFIEEMLNS